MEWILASGFWAEWSSIAIEWSEAIGPYLWASIAWGVLAVAAVLGFVGVFIPVIPGALVLFLGALAHKLMLPEDLSWWGILILGVCVVLDRLIDLFATAAGAKWFGGTKWGIFGALAGGLVGLFFGFIGILLGPVIGAVVFELLWARRHPKEAARSGMGAGLGFGLSALGRMFLFFAMLAVVAVDYAMEEVSEGSEPVRAQEEQA